MLSICTAFPHCFSTLFIHTVYPHCFTPLFSPTVFPPCLSILLIYPHCFIMLYLLHTWHVQILFDGWHFATHTHRLYGWTEQIMHQFIYYLIPECMFESSCIKHGRHSRTIVLGLWLVLFFRKKMCQFGMERTDCHWISEARLPYNFIQFSVIEINLFCMRNNMICDKQHIRTWNGEWIDTRKILKCTMY